MRRIALALTVAALSVAWTHHADGATVERVVAVVGERPILLSELHHRAQPDLMMMMNQNPAHGSVEQATVYRRVLEHLIDEQLVAQAAQKAHLAVSVDDIDRAILQKANELDITQNELMEEVRREGLSEQEYRDEIRRQILEGKLVQLRVAGIVRVTEADAQDAYKKWAKDYEAATPVELHILPLLLPQDATQRAGVRALAENILARARNGEDFCRLIAQYSAHPSPRDCGTRIVPLQALPKAVQSQSASGTFTAFQFDNEIDIIQNVGSSAKPPPYAQVRDKMIAIAGAELIARERDVYLRELRRGVHIEIRLNG